MPLSTSHADQSSSRDEITNAAKDDRGSPSSGHPGNCRSLLGHNFLQQHTCPNGKEETYEPSGS